MYSKLFITVGYEKYVDEILHPADGVMGLHSY